MKANRAIQQALNADSNTMRDAGSPFNVEKRPQLLEPYAG
jgi:hypothetical protein